MASEHSIDGFNQILKHHLNNLYKNYYFRANNIYFDSDLVWRMQLMIIKGKNSCCVCYEFLTFNAY